MMTASDASAMTRSANADMIMNNIEIAARLGLHMATMEVDYMKEGDLQKQITLLEYNGFKVHIQNLSKKTLRIIW